MLESAAEYLNANATLLFFSILALGYFVGKLGFGEFRLGAVAGVLFVGLFFGHFGFEMGPAAQTFGFSIFIFAVGYEAGPQFFEVMRTDGLRYLSLALVVVITGVLLTLMLTRAFDFQPGISAGLLGGALTTTPTLAAAQEALRTGNAIPPDGFPVQQAIDNAGAAYAITYLFGVIGLILLLKLLPRLLKIDLPAQAAALKVSETNAGQQAKNMVPRTYRVLRDGYSVHEVEDYAGRLRVMQVRRSDEALEFELTTRLEIGDEILVLGTPGAFVSLPADRFTETADVANFDTKLESVAVIIEKPALVGKSLSEISARRGPAGVFILGIQQGTVIFEQRHCRIILVWLALNHLVYTFLQLVAQSPYGIGLLTVIDSINFIFYPAYILVFGTDAAGNSPQVFQNLAGGSGYKIKRKTVVYFK